MFDTRSRSFRLGALGTLVWSLFEPGCGRAENEGLFPCGSTGAGGSAGATNSGRARGGNTPATGVIGWGGSSDAGTGGSDGGGAMVGGAGAGGVVVESGRGGSSGLGGAGSEGVAGEGGTIERGDDSGGIGGEGGQPDPGQPTSCEDGCALLYVPFRALSQQFFTINLDLDDGVDLSRSVLTARIRAVGYDGIDESIKLYANASPDYSYWGGAPTVNLSELADGGTLTMDLTVTPGWDNTKVMTIGFQINGGSTLGLGSLGIPVWIVVEEITVTNSKIYGPWSFIEPASVNESPDVTPTYSTPDILFVNSFNKIEGTRVTWIASSSDAPGAPGGAR